MSKKCISCGVELEDEAVFCDECGAQQTPPQLQAESKKRLAKGIPVKKEKPTTAAKKDGGELPKKKSKKLLIILGAAVAVVILIIVIIIASIGEDEIDYEATVKAHTPFAVSQGLPYTYSEVFDKYIGSQKCEIRESEDEVCVDISGVLEGTGLEVTVTIKVIPNPEEPDGALIRPDTITLDGVKSTTQDEAVQFLYALFTAYEEGYENLSMLQSFMGNQGAVELTEVYTNEEEGISFRYPEEWWVTDSGNSLIPCVIYSADSRAMLQVAYALYDFYEVLTEDKATVEKNCTEAGGEFIDLLETSIDGVPARILVTKSKEEPWKGDGDLINKDYWYTIGDDAYYVRCSYPMSASEDYESIFGSIMDTYTITAREQQERRSDSNADDLSFDGILEQYTKAIREGWDMEQAMDANLNYQALYDGGYAYMDVTGDGIDELLVGSNDYGIIYDLYTIVDGKATLVFQSGEREMYYFCGDGVIASVASSSAFESYYFYYKVNDRGEIYLCDGIEIDTSRDENSPDYYYIAQLDLSSIVPISESDANEIVDKYMQEPISFMPFIKNDSEDGQGGWGNPVSAGEIELYEISGGYTGIWGNSTASISMYSSGEEEGAVGNISLYLDSQIPVYGGLSIEGELTKLDVNQFYVQYDAMKVLLDVSRDDNGHITIELYINDGLVESYLMTEQYIS